MYQSVAMLTMEATYVPGCHAHTQSLLDICSVTVYTAGVIKFPTYLPTYPLDK